MRVLVRQLRDFAPAAGVVVAAAPLLYWLSRVNYLLFHVLVELVCVVVAIGTFAVAWSTRRNLQNGYLLVLGLTALFVGALDLTHTLTFKGMGVFPARGANTATQLWVAARALESLSFVAAAVLVRRRVPVAAVLSACALVTAGLLAAVFTGLFPACYVDGVGLTPFKIGAEIAVIAVLLLALRLLWRARAHFAPDVFATLTLALALLAVAEASFTLYRDVTGVFNMLGHLFKLAAFVLIYRALVVTGIARPFDVLYRALKQNEGALQRDNAALAVYQRELEAKNAELAALSASKNELLGIAAHDIRSPMTVVEMYTTLLAERLRQHPDAEARKFLDVIQRTNRKIFALVSDLLDYTAIEAGTLSLTRRPLALREVVEETLESHIAIARSKGIEIRFTPPAQSPTVSADPLRIEQVIGNLVSNAVKFAPRDSVVTLVIVSAPNAAGVSVTDQGPGLAAAEIPKVFAPFRKSTARGTAGETSTGLGLAIVRKIVDAHGGRVEVESAPGRGATFTFLIPLAGEPAGAPAIASAAS